MIQRVVKSNGKTYLVNCAGGDDMGIGPGFAIGELVMKSATDGQWYMVMSSGSVGNITVYVNQTPLGFTAGPSYTQGVNTASYVMAPSFYEQNFPYQLLAAPNGNAYAVYLTGTAPNVVVAISKMFTNNDFATFIDTWTLGNWAKLFPYE